MSDQVTAQRQTLRRRLAHRLRYSNKFGAGRASVVVGARDWPHAVMALTGSNWCGDYNDPPFAPTLRYPWEGEERVFANNNDGMELWFGYPDRWTWHIGTEEMKRLTRFLVVDVWLKARWCGLRRPIYYAALHAAVGQTRRATRKAKS